MTQIVLNSSPILKIVPVVDLTSGNKDSVNIHAKSRVTLDENMRVDSNFSDPQIIIHNV